MTITPLTPAIGVEVTGQPGRRLLDLDAAEELRTALDAHGVVVCREAGLEDGELVALSRMFGEVVIAKGSTEEYPEVQIISLDPARSRLASYQQGTFSWHIDGATDATPQKATFLVARQVSDEGGDTEFANTYAAYAALTEAQRKELDGLRVLHTFKAAQLLANPNPSDAQLAAWERVPTREHPLVWTRRDGRKSLLIGATTDHVIGMAPAESRALLDRLLQWSTQPRLVLRHHWRPGDLVIWDNTGMLHRALPYRPTSPRLMHRTTLVGDEAVV
ncbi:TauD/TfdA dioxygenase family protein [Streptomyces himalayensis]|uniref:TauD/TfdA dioxygenase family protein n=1 Tax=Streptomyces himalayensis TaxID=2820085 RepID=UPI001C69C037|nr:TauD/TfdA family dioxygenase [Streptomyces himalayensis]